MVVEVGQAQVAVLGQEHPADEGGHAGHAGSTVRAKESVVTLGETNSAPTGRSAAHDEWMSPESTATFVGPSGSPHRSKSRRRSAG